MTDDLVCPSCGEPRPVGRVKVVINRGPGAFLLSDQGWKVLFGRERSADDPDDAEIARDDPKLVALIERLERRASDVDCELVVVETEEVWCILDWQRFQVDEKRFGMFLGKRRGGEMLVELTGRRRMLGGPTEEICTLTPGRVHTLNG